MKPKLISEDDLPKIEKLLTKWSGKLTWDLFADAVAKALGRPSISKFTLMGYEPIKQAYKHRKEWIRDEKAEVAQSGDVAVDALIEEITKLRGQVAYLEEEKARMKDKYVEMFSRWQYNLSQMPNVDLSRLDQPLPKTDRAGVKGRQS
jgi:predicted nuclease with TOPRIM domain